MVMQAQAPALPPGSRHHLSRGGWLWPGLLTAEGAALVVLLAADGSPLGRVVRALAAAAMTGLAAWLMARGGRAGRGAVALVAGIAGTVTGAGVASAQARAGLSVTVLAALVALVAGIYRAVRALDPQQVAQAVPAMQLMGWVRALPLRISARRRPERHEGIGHRPVGAGVISNHSSVKNPHSA